MEQLKKITFFPGMWEQFGERGVTFKHSLNGRRLHPSPEREAGRKYILNEDTEVPALNKVGGEEVCLLRSGGGIYYKQRICQNYPF